MKSSYFPLSIFLSLFFSVCQSPVAMSAENDTDGRPGATNPLEVRETVHQVVVKKFEDGQFDRCGFSTRTLARMEAAFTQTLVRVLHKRIDYPETGPKKKNHSLPQVP